MEALVKLPFFLITLLLLSAVARADFKDDFLNYSADGKLEELDVLINDRLDAGGTIDFNMKSDNGDTALILAAWNSRPEIIRFLMQFRSKGLDLNIESKYNETALTLATYKQCFECAKILVNNKATINNVGAKKKNALFMLFYDRVNDRNIKDIENLAIYMVNNGADVLAKDENANTFLTPASKYQLHDFAKLLVSKGVRINTKNNAGVSPLMIAASWGDNFLVDFYLKNNAYKTLYDNDGNGPLHFAVMSDKLDTVKLLLQNDFDIKISNKKDMDAFDIAARQNNLKIYDFLKSSFPNHYVRQTTSDLVSAIKRYDQTLKSFLELTTKVSPVAPKLDSKPGYSVDSDKYYEVIFERWHACSADSSVYLEYEMDFSDKERKLYFDTRDIVENGKTNYQIYLTSSIDYNYRGLKGLTFSFQSSADRQSWFDMKSQLEFLAEEIIKVVPLQFKSGRGVSLCD